MEELPARLIRRAKDKRKYHEGIPLKEPLLPNSKWYPTMEEIQAFYQEKPKQPQQKTPPARGRLLSEGEKNEAFERAKQKVDKQYNHNPIKHKYKQSYRYTGDCEDVWEMLENNLPLDDIEYTKLRRN